MSTTAIATDIADLAAPTRRVVARVPEGVRRMIEEAAELTGSTLNQFLVQSAYKEARDVLERETTLRLTESQARLMFAMMENPPAPNAKLLKAAARFKTTIVH